MDTMVKASRDDLLERLTAGEWLSAGAVATILSLPGRPISIRTVQRMLESGQIRWTSPTPGGHRQCNPADVRAQLARRQNDGE